MKIDPSEKQQNILSSQNVKPVNRDGTGNDFAKVLGDTVQNSSTSQTQTSGIVQPSMAARMVMPIVPVAGASEPSTAHGLLDALEKYQNLLGDSDANLKMVSPAVEKMKTISKQAQPIIDNMPEGHPLKAVAQEALMEMSKEIARFSTGYYVDE